MCQRARGKLAAKFEAFDIALGVRHADTAFAALLDTLLVRERPAIQRILHDYGVPVLAGADQEKQ